MARVRGKRVKLRRRRRSSSSDIDAVDEAILDILRGNGRATNQEIAEQLSITAATVSTRLTRLEEEKLAKVVAVADFSAFGYEMLVAAGIKVSGRSVDAVARDLVEMSEVASVHIMEGAYDIEILVVTRDFEEVKTFLLERVGAIPGISEVDPAIADIVKFGFNVAPL